MKFLIKTWSFTALMVCLTNACQKATNPDPDLPLATQEGKGTIGCYINGKPWVPKPYLCVVCIPYFRVDRMLREDSMTFSAAKSGQYMEFEWKSVRLGEYQILNSSVFLDANAGKSYDLDKNRSNKITLMKIDSVNGIIAGTFEFTAIDKKSKDTIVVTKGRFDSGMYTSTFW
jgi:Family of unknown function (DUF6252)